MKVHLSAWNSVRQGVDAQEMVTDGVTVIVIVAISFSALYRIILFIFYYPFNIF